MRDSKALKVLKGRLATDPETVLEASERFLSGSGAGTPVVWAEHVLLAMLARQRLLVWREADVDPAAEAIEIFGVNDRISEYCELLDLRARLLFVKGRVKEAIVDSLQAFHEARASAEERLLGARTALMALRGNSGSSVARQLRHDVLNLARTTGPNAASFLATACARCHDFVTALSAAGYPGGSIALIGSEPRGGEDLVTLVRALRAELLALCPPEPMKVLADPTPFLLLARFDAIEHPGGDWLGRLQQVRVRYGRRYAPHCWATEALCHASRRDFQVALAALTQAMQMFEDCGMPYLRIGLLYPLASIQRECGDVEGALRALVEFNAHVWDKLTGVELPYDHRVRGPTGTGGGTDDPGHDPADPRKMQSEPPYLRRALRYIRDRFADDITVQDIVDNARVSRRALETAMRAYRQTTPLAALRVTRLQEARHLLMKQELSVKEVSQAVGYKSASAFSRDFREYFGVAPKDAITGALQGQGGALPRRGSRGSGESI